MSILSTEEIVSKLSTKFNKIFYDRDFICSVQEDLEVILKNTKKCCVVIFPVLGPHYLKAVQYQAKIFNLAAFTLGTDRISSVAVCHRDFLMKKVELDKAKISEKEMDEVLKCKRKRPERQLYVPPAQRGAKSRSEISKQSSSRKKDEERLVKEKKHTTEISSEHLQESVKEDVESAKSGAILQNTIKIKDNVEYKEDVQEKEFKFDYFEYLKWNYYPYSFWHYDLFENNKHLTNVSNISKLIQHKVFENLRKIIIQIPLFSYTTERKLFLLKRNMLFWQPKLNFFVNGSNWDFQIFPQLDCEHVNTEIPISNVIDRRPVVDVDCVELLQTKEHILTKAPDLVWIKNNCYRECSSLDLFYDSYYFLVDDRKEKEQEAYENWLEYQELLYVDKVKEESKTSVAFKSENDASKMETSVEDIVLLSEKEESDSSVLFSVNNEVLIPKIDETVPKNQKIAISNSKVTNAGKKTVNEQIIEKKDDHDEEKEIMRKTKENINRKTRPIMKYVDSTDELKIGEDDNVNNWEDLFDESGQLYDNIMKEIFHKVGNEVTIVKAKEDYTDYSVKQIEELEHMVELYDFPPSLETNELIYAFREIKSDAMYIKWVDNTHAILVLGSLTQAQKAISTNHPMIKVRPMSAASNASLATAYKHDLKPAMKRPQTNLQTARRLITSHLGAKCNISRERSAKERNDLKEAKEMKKLLKKSEQDAWEGNLRSSLT